MSILVVDVGTSGVRAAIVRPDADRHRRPLPRGPARPRPRPASSSSTPPRWPTPRSRRHGPASPSGGPVDAVGIANQRASTIVWDRATGEPVGPGIGWQDLRTVGDVPGAAGAGLPPRAQRVGHQGRSTCSTWPTPTAPATCASAPSTRWIAWHLSGGRRPRHRPDQRRAHRPPHRRRPRAGTTELLDALRIPEASLPEVVDSSGRGPEAVALDGAPPIAGIAGDQQASLVGQGCVRPGPGQDHLRHRRHARPVPRRRAAVAS